MTEIFDMDMNDMLEEDSELVESLKASLETQGVQIDVNDLSTILHEYELTKMEFLKSYIMQMLSERGGNFADMPDGPMKVVISNKGMDFEPAETLSHDDSELESHFVS